MWNFRSKIKELFVMHKIMLLISLLVEMKKESERTDLLLDRTWLND